MPDLPIDDEYIRCTRKEGFSYQKARRIARRIRRSSDEAVTEYHCRDCKLWHIGGETDREVRRSQKRRTKKRRGRGQLVVCS